MEKLSDYGPIGIVALLSFLAVGVLWKDNKRLEKQKDDLLVDVKDNVTLTIKSVNDTMKAILIAVESDTDAHKRYVEDCKNNAVSVKN